MKGKLITLLKIIIVDVILIESFVICVDPDISSSIVVLLVLPYLFIVNIVVSVIMYIKNRYYSLLFLLNSFISMAIMWFLFGLGIKLHERRVVDEWDVSIKGKEFVIVNPAGDNKFFITIKYPGGREEQNQNDRGVIQSRNDTLFFSTADTIHFFIHDDYIFNFKGTKKEKVKKVL